MAAPITHIVLANKVYDNFLSSFSKRDFFIGTSFPDIRYLKVIERNKTHFKSLKLEQIKTDNPFMAGVKFHSIVDESREKYMVSEGIYSEMSKSGITIQALKCLEDELFYNNFDNWNGLIDDFKNIPYEQIGFDVDKIDIEKWYGLLRDYFRSKPTPPTRKKFIKQIGFNEKDAQEMNEIIEKIKKNTRALSVINRLYDKFDFLLK